MFHLLPPTLARVADAADRKDSTRFALGNVHLRINADGTFTADATDSKRLLRVTGPCLPAEDFPADAVPGLATAPNGATAALVPATAWRKAFTSAEKLTRKVARTKPVLGSVAVSLSGDVTTFGATDLVAPTCETVANGTGRFPPTDDIMRQSRKVKPLFSVDPLLLADQLRALADFCDDTGMRVDFSTACPGKPLFITAHGNEFGLEATGLIMPLGDSESVAPAGRSADSDTLGVEVAPAAADECRRECEALRARVAELERELAAVRATRWSDVVERVVAPATCGELPTAGPVAPAQVSVAPAGRPLTRAERIALIRAAAPTTAVTV